MKPIKSSLFNMIASMLIVSALSALIVGYVHQKTAAPIEVSKNKKILEAISEVIGEFDNDPFTERTYIYSTDGKSKLELYPARENGIITSVAIKTYSDNGYGGKIEIIVGILMDGTITGYKVIEQKETPGLGDKISSKRFSEQFVGLNTYDGEIKLKKDGGEIDALTSATISSRAVIDAVEKAASAYNKFSAGATGNDK